MQRAFRVVIQWIELAAQVGAPHASTLVKGSQPAHSGDNIPVLAIDRVHCVNIGGLHIGSHQGISLTLAYDKALLKPLAHAGEAQTFKHSGKDFPLDGLNGWAVEGLAHPFGEQRSAYRCPLPKGSHLPGREEHGFHAPCLAAKGQHL